MDKFKELIIKILEGNKESSIEEITNKIIDVSTSDNIVGFFTAKDIGDAYTLGAVHQRNCKEGEKVWDSETISKIWLEADDLNKNINWE